jgi:hypothetical protein
MAHLRLLDHHFAYSSGIGWVSMMGPTNSVFKATANRFRYGI